MKCIQIYQHQIGFLADLDRTDLIYADTEETHNRGSTAASRVSFIVGNALIAAARKLRWEGGDSATGSVVFPGSLEKWKRAGPMAPREEENWGWWLSPRPLSPLLRSRLV